MRLRKTSKHYESMAVFLLSLSTLAYEVLLARIFSITQWNHLSFMVIAIALFGFALGGTCLSIGESAKKNRLTSLSLKPLIQVLTVLYAVLAIASFTVLNKIPLDYFRLPFEWNQLFFLLAAYLTLALPFFLAGLVIALCYTYIPEKTAFIYFASMAGSACGAVMPAVFLPPLGEARLVAVAAALPLLILLLKPSGPAGSAAANRFGKPTSKFSALSGVLLVLFAIVSVGAYGTVDLKPSPYKALSQALRLPEARLLETHTSLKGRVNRVESPHIRFATGLSLKYLRPLPGQSAFYNDGDRPLVLYDRFDPPAKLFVRYTLAFSGYLLHPRPESVLLIQRGGGLGILCALASEAAEITVIEENAFIARALAGHYKLPVINENPRSFLAKSKRRYRVIQVENWGGSIPAAAALNQEHLFTRQAFTRYFRHLLPGGVLIMARRLLLPPSDSIRLWATAYESLRDLGMPDPEKHLALLRNWDSCTLIASTRPLGNLTPLRNFAQKNNFDFVHLDQITEKEINRFNVFKAPYHYLEINRLKQAYRRGAEKDFFAQYLLDIAPQSDRRPYPNRFLKWSRIRSIYKSSGSRIYSLLMSGEIVILAVFLEALLISTILLLLPLLFTTGKSGRPRLPQILYFLTVGMGFMFLELYYIKAFVLLFGDPVVSLTVVLATILIFSGVGGFYSQNFKRENLGYILIVLVVVLAGSLFGMNSIIQRLLGLPIFLRYLFAITLMLPAGLLMGLPFPLGMRCLLSFPEQRAYAWAVNGCASVLTSIISAQIALSAGIPVLLLGGILSYLLAWCFVGGLKTA
jgi:hypothetical protein